MTQLFLKLLNMSITASWLVLAVILLRGILFKAPKWINCLLWEIVAFRLMIPVPLESVFSMIPSGEVIPQDVVTSQAPAIHSGIPAVNSAVNPFLTEQVIAGNNKLDTLLTAASAVWVAGIVLLALYNLVTWFRLHRQVRVSICCRENIYICDDLQSPFILGVFKPRIYLPSGLDQTQWQDVLSHEYAHIKRRDHWWKPLGFFLLSIYWFNPLLWVAYVLLCRDIEKACDEKVISSMDAAGKRRYAETLVACSVHRRMIMACPIAFGEVSVKSRIKGILTYKRPAFWVVMISAAACLFTAACFLTDPIPCSHEYDVQGTVAATCTKKGMQTNTCRLCGHSYTAPIDRIAHSYDTGTVATEATCIRFGSIVYTCTGCGKEKAQTLAKTAHIPGGPYFIKAPHCTKTGEKRATCTVCKAVFVTEVLPMNDVHDLKETVVQEATCTAAGEGVKACTRCSYEESITYEQLTHDFHSYDLIEASCTQEGIRRKQCIRCSYYEDEGIPMYEHNWVSAAPFGKRCTRCNIGVDSFPCVNPFKINPYLTPTVSYPVISWDPPGISWNGYMAR